MAMVSSWVGVGCASILLVSAGCSIAPRPFSNAKRGGPPKRLMATRPAVMQPELSRVIEPPREFVSSNAETLNPPLPLMSVPQALAVAEQVIVTSSAQNLLEQLPPPPAPALPSSPRMTLAATQLAALEDQDRLASGDLSTNALLPISPPAPLTSVLPELAAMPQIVHVERHPTLEVKDAALPAEVADPIAVPEPAPLSLPEPVKNETVAIAKIETAISLVEFPKSSSEPTLPVAVPEASTITAVSPPMVDNHNETAATQPESEPIQRSLTGDDEDLEFLLPRIADSKTNAVEFRRNQAWAPSATESATRMTEEASDETQFVEPRIVTIGISNVELRSFFEPFNVQMISRLRARRVEFQGPMVEMVKDVNLSSEIRSRAMLLLGAIGPEAIDAVPALEQVLRRKSDPFFKIRLAESILKIAPENELAIEVLTEGLSAPNPSVQWAATFALRNASSVHTSCIVDRLRKLIATNDPKLRKMAFLTLAEFGPAAAAAIPDLETALQSSDPELCEVARACLACIAPGQKITTRSHEASSESNRIQWISPSP